MDVEKVLCMVEGSGETSYATNSKLQVGFLLANAGLKYVQLLIKNRINIISCCY